MADQNTQTFNTSSGNPPNGQLPETSVILFSESNYRGKPVPIHGAKNIGWIEDVGFPNDALRSLIIDQDYNVTLYSDSQFKGASKTYSGPLQVPYVGDDFDKKTSSLKITKKGSNFQAGSTNWFLIILLIILVVVIIWLVLRQKKKQI